MKRRRDLRVEVDRNLEFHCNVSKLVRSAAELSNSLLRVTVNRRPKFIIRLFVTHIRHILDYCLTVGNVV